MKRDLETARAWQRRSKHLRARSAKTARWYAAVRRPAVALAVRDGRQPCQMRTPACTGYVQGLHEPFTRARAGSAQKAHEAGTIACCHGCNEWAGEHPREAEALGLLRRAG